MSDKYFDLINYIIKHPQVAGVQQQSNTPLYGDGEVVVFRIYIEDKPPDLGVHVGDGLGVKLERGD